MADIFDQIAAESLSSGGEGDIFDQIASEVAKPAPQNPTDKAAGAIKNTLSYITDLFKPGGTVQTVASGGISGVAGMADLFNSLSPVGIKGGFTPGDAVRAASDTLTGIPNSSKIGENTLAYKIGEYIPGVLSPGSKATAVANPLMSVARRIIDPKFIARTAAEAATLGSLGYVGNESAGPIGELVLSGTGALASGHISSLTKAAKQEVAQAQATEIIKNALSSPVDNVVAAIDAQPKTLTSPFQRTAEVTGDTGLASLEEATTRMDLAGAKGDFAAQNAKREGVRQSLYDQVTPVEATREEAGEAIRSGLEAAKGEQKGIVDFYGDRVREGKGTIDTDPIKRSVRQSVYDATKSGVNEISGSFKDDLLRFLSEKKDASLATLQDWRAKFADYLKPGPSASPADKANARIAATVRSSIDEHIGRAVSEGQLPKDEALDFGKLIEERRNLGSDFESRGVGKVLEQDEFGNWYKVDSSKVGKTVATTPSETRQTVNALRGQKAGKEALETSLLDDLRESTTVNRQSDEFIPGSFERERTKRAGILKEGLTQEQNQVLDFIGSDLSSQAAVTERGLSATKKNSTTAEAESAIEQIQNAISSKTSSTLEKIPYIGSAAKALYSFVDNPAVRERLLNEQIVRVVKDPKYAKELLTAPGKASRALKEISRGLVASVNSYRIGKKEKELENSGTFNTFKKEKEYDPLEAVLGRSGSVSDVSDTEKEIDADPFYSALYEIESGRNPKAANKESSAKGGFQLIDATAKSLGVKDPFDLKESFDGVKRLTEEHRERFGDDPKLLYAAHYLGQNTLAKWLNGDPLTKQQAAQVDFLERVVMPRFEKVYRRVSA